MWTLLRSSGIDARLDLTAAVERQFWPQWMSKQVREAQFVLVVASAAYRERGEDRGDRSTGKGVRWETLQLMERWYSDLDAGLREILPVVLPGGDRSGLPSWILPDGGTVYSVEEFTLAGAEPLLRVLTGQPLEVEPALGSVPVLPTRPPADIGPPVAARGLRSELVIDARVVEGSLLCEASLAGVPLGSREGPVPAELSRVWESFKAGPLVAAERLSAAGRALADAVFDEEGQRLVASLVTGMRPQDAVEVVWRADGAALALPVEALQLTCAGGADLGPLVLVGGVSVRRQVREAGPGREAAGLPGPLRVLAAVAAPEETRTPNAPLDVEAEMQALLDSVGDLAAGHGGQVRILEVASLTQIRAALREGAFHVLHLSAHGSSTSVELEDEDGDPQLVGSRDLMTVIRDAGASVPLIVLSSCAGAAGGGEAMAAGLVAAGADRVLAMQTSITDTYATALLAEFYRELVTAPADGPLPRVSEALARARRARELARRTADELPLPEYAVTTLLCAGADPPLIDATRAPRPLPDVAVPTGTSVRDLGMGQLIGRRSQLRAGTAALRRTDQARATHGLISGVQLVGVGGIGKTALAGRLMTRARGDGMLPVVHEGRWNPTTLFTALAQTLAKTEGNEQVAGLLAAAEMSDVVKVQMVGKLLESAPLLLVFDDFEQNLSPGGASFLDPAFDEVFTGWCEKADVGAVLVTCRYPLPGDDRYLAPVAVGPLSTAELRRLLLRLPALRGLSGEDLRLLNRTIGGHPRLIEYVDALLRGRPTRFREVQRKLRDLAQREGIDLRRPRPINTAVNDAVILGGADILLDELLDLLTNDERETLAQLSVSRAAMTLDDLAYAMTDPNPDGTVSIPSDAQHLSADVERLTDLTLLAPVDGILVHPWTADLIERREDPSRADRHERALRMRWRRLQSGPIDYDDLVDIPRHLAATDKHVQIPGLARQVVAALPGVLAAAAYLAEIRPLIPRGHFAWVGIGKLEYEAIRAVGDLTSAQTLLNDVYDSISERFATNSDDEQTAADMSMVLVDLGDLAVATGDLHTATSRFTSALDLNARQPDDTQNAAWWHNRPALVRERLGGVAVAAGDLTAAREHFQASLEIRQRLAAADPGNTDWQRDLSISRERLGGVAIAAGDLTTAREHCQASLEIAQRLAAADPSNAGCQRDLSISRNKVGDVAVAAGDLTTAREHFKASLEIRQRLAAADPGNTGWQRDLSVSRERLGTVAVAAGDLTTAREHFQASLEIAQRLAAADPGNTEWHRDLSVSLNKVGDVAVAAGDLSTAREHFHASLEIAQRLAAADPGNTDWQRDLSVSLNRVGNVAVAAGDPNTAREHFHASLEIAQRLAAADPGNTDWQRDLSVTRERLGTVAVAAGDLTTARQHFQASLGIAQRLLTADPGNAERQRDLSVSLNKVGDVAAVAGDPNAAREHFQASLEIRRQLAATDPGNTRWQRDLSINWERLGDMAVAAGDLTTAREHFLASLEIRQQLAAAHPGNAEWQRDLSINWERLGDVAVAAGDLTTAREHFLASLEIRQQLAAASPGNAEWQRDLSINWERLGDLAVAARDLTTAREHFQASLEIYQRLSAANPGNTEWQRDLSEIAAKLHDAKADGPDQH
ncbi:CHAT domain-containing protein [Asanoa ishikariensis]|uniref:CHAT domain-containing protein n=1 Tax=Asanoa ishikariensis TaxID=137265 RepID=A0A1H3TTI9_9ACTN|nr:CHAT domain-containing protein [Asanoa ishikariensis]